MSLQSAMQAAKDAASNVPAVQDGGTEVINTSSNTALGMGLDDFLSGGMQVDLWLQIKDAGLRLDRNDKAFIDEFNASLDISSVQFFHGVRAELSGAATYIKSYDGGKTTNKGENFRSADAYLKQNGQKYTGLYRGADMVLVLTEDVTQGKATIPAGTRVGYTTPITGFAPFQNLLKKLAAEGLATDAGGGRLAGGTVDVKATHSTEKNKNNIDYGVLSFEILD